MAGSDKTVKVVLVADASPLKRGMADASTATKKLGGDIDGVSAKSKGLSGGLDKATGALKGMAAGGAALAGTALVSFLSDAVAAAGDLEQSIGGVDAVFKDSAAQIHDFGKNAAENVGLSTNAFNELITVTGAMLKNKGLEDFAQKSLDLVQIGADLSATYGGTAKEAVEALNAAMRGESDPIERYGISLNETAVNAEIMAKGLSGLTGAALDQAKAQARIDIITRQSADALGKFASESDTLQGQQQRLNAEWENAQALLGQQLLPLMTQLVETMRGGVAVVEALTGAFSSMPSWLQEILGVIERVISPLTGLLKLLGLLSPEQEKAAASAQKQAVATAKSATATATAGDASKKAAKEIDTLAIRTKVAREAAKAAADAHRDLAQAILDISDAAVSADQAEADWQQSIDDATAAIKENGRTVNKARTEIDTHTQAGRDNQAQLINMRDRALEAAEANLTQGDSVKSVKDRMADAREEFIRVAKKMGLTKDAAKALADEYNLTTGKVDTLNTSIGETPKETKTRITAETAAAQTAIDGVNAMLTALENRRIVVPVTAAVGGLVGSVNNVGSLFGWKPRATGGPVRKGGAYLVGDNADGTPNKTSELFVPKTDGFIMNASDTRDFMNFKGGNVSRGGPSVGGSVMSASALAAAIAPLLRPVQINTPAAPDPMALSREIAWDVTH